jgi:Zn-dependent protease with chaperone function
MSNNGSNLDSKRKRFAELDASAFRHPLDRVATEQLKKLRGFDMLVAKYLEFCVERLEQMVNSASNVKVGPRQMPSLYEMLRESCAVLDMPEPELFVSQAPGVNAYTSGHTRPHIVLYADLLDLMTDEEVMVVIAHELGHIKCGHVLYMTMATQIDGLIAFVKEGLPVVGQVVGLGMDWTVKIALLLWKRRAELTADRAALLVMQDARPCISMLMKLAGGSMRLATQLNPGEFLLQARAYEEEKDKSILNRFYRFYIDASKGTHPFAVERARYLNDWIGSIEYAQILAGNYPRVTTSPFK